MKKLLLPIAFTLSTAASAQLHNGGFEDLNSSEFPAFWQGNMVLLPVWIDSTGESHTDSVVFDGGANYLLNTTDVHSGQHAIELRNGYDFTTSTPFIGAWSAVPDSEGYMGFPLVQIQTATPVSIGFYAKYFPVNGDSALVTATVLNDLGDEIGTGSLTIQGTVVAYTAFDMPITYTSADPGMWLQLTFANAHSSGHASLGTRFLIDDVSVSTLQGVEEQAALPELTLFPNPAHGSFTLRTGAAITGLAAVDMNGREQGLERGRDGTVDCTGLAAGSYVLRAITPQGELRRVLVVR